MRKFDLDKLTSEGKEERVVAIPANAGLYIKIYRSGRKKFYYRQIIAKGRSKFIALGAYPLYDIDRAREKMMQVKRSIEFGEFYSKDENITFVDVMKKAISAHLTGAKPTTIKTLSVRCNRLISHFRNAKLTAITPQMVRDLYNPLETQGQLATLKRINQMMEIVFQYAIKNGYMAEDKNPLIAVNYSKNYKKYENSAATHYPKLVSLDDLRDFFRNLAEQDESKITYSVATIFLRDYGTTRRIGSHSKMELFFARLFGANLPKIEAQGRIKHRGTPRRPYSADSAYTATDFAKI